jgi:DNA repair protein RecO (recombination protein O)
MLITTKAIVLNLQRHSDRSHILHTYTQHSGRINFLVYGVGSKKKSAALYAPLSLIEITADIRPDRPIPTLKEARLLRAANSPNAALVTQLKSNAVSLFLAELLYGTLRHPMPDETMFHFLENALSVLDTTTALENFHTSFLMDFAAALGFAIDEKEHPALLRVPVSRADRQLLLRQLCDYYALHLDDFRTPLSLDVLIEVFD